MAPTDSDRHWIEWTLSKVHNITGVEVKGDPGSHNHTTTFTAAVSTDGRNFHPVDGGSPLAGNWEGNHNARSLFAGGPVTGRSVRLYPESYAGSPVLHASLVVQSCAASDADPMPSLQCRALKCQAYCFKSLGCEGDFKRYCEMEKADVRTGTCDVECSRAPRGAWVGAIPLALALALAGTT